jgi:hypothetical protein
MSSSPTTSESALAESLRPRLRSTLQPLLNHASPCLPALEKTCQKILSLTGGLTGADRLAQIISRDPALSCRVLQVSNSIAYRLQQVITSIPYAVSWLGLDTVRSIVTASQLVEQLSQWPNQQPIVSRVIARALVAAGHGTRVSIVEQLFSATLLYSSCFQSKSIRARSGGPPVRRCSRASSSPPTGSAKGLPRLPAVFRPDDAEYQSIGRSTLDPGASPNGYCAISVSRVPGTHSSRFQDFKTFCSLNVRVYR